MSHAHLMVDAEELLPAPLVKEWHQLRDGDHSEPHRILGAHSGIIRGQAGAIVRVYRPDAAGVTLRTPEGETAALKILGGHGLFAVFLPGARLPLEYTLVLRFPDGNTFECRDPYSFYPTIGDVDLHLFNEGTHRRLWERMGARVLNHQGAAGVAFTVWAPSARRVAVVGDFCHWDGRLFPMRSMGSSGVFELFLPGLAGGEQYKFEIKTHEGELRLKTDPFGAWMEPPPGAASRVYHSTYRWNDAAWLARRPTRDYAREPLSIYEVHLGSWRRVPEEGHRMMSYREIAAPLVEHVKRLGFTHVELTPIAEHAFGASWGYQVTGYYAPTARHGTPDDFRHFVDYCHQNGVGVILDWVPGHFPKDDFALRRFDGTALYEHEDPRQGEHPDWGTLIFNYGRHEVRGFLLSNALYWLAEFHVDGLRVDAVASMLYLDYSRKPGEWIPNAYGGKENLEAIAFLQTVNNVVHEEFPGSLMIAEESTGWTGVSRPVAEHGLGFDFKWNMGWMHDTLFYFSKDAVHRKHHHHELTFAMLYEHSERFINPLSHDEVVHGKRSLLEKMPGDYWQKFANLRALLAYQYTRPGKKLLFMGTEIAPYSEWYYDASLDWHLAEDPMRIGLRKFMEDLGQLYHQTACIWGGDPDGDGFYWIDCDDWQQSVFSYVRQYRGAFVIVVLNLTPVPRDHYRIGAPVAGRYVQRMSSDDAAYGGSGYVTTLEPATDPVPMHRQQQSLVLRLPPLAALILAPTW